MYDQPISSTRILALVTLLLFLLQGLGVTVYSQSVPIQ